MTEYFKLDANLVCIFITTEMKRILCEFNANLQDEVCHDVFYVSIKKFHMLRFLMKVAPLILNCITKQLKLTSYEHISL